MIQSAYLGVLFLISYFVVSKLFGHKIPEKDGLMNEFIRQLFTMPNIFFGVLFIVISIGLILTECFGLESSHRIMWYYQYVFTPVIYASMGPAIGRHHKRVKKNKKKRRIIRTI